MKREACIRINVGTEEFGGQAVRKKLWKGPRERTQGRGRSSGDGGGSSKGERGHGDSENESRWKKSGRKGRRGSETKMTPSEVQQMLDWCEEEAALTTAKCSEEIQAEKEDRKRCEEAVVGELEEIAARTPLGRVRADFDWEKEERRKREIGEEERREWEREKQMRDKLAEAEKEKREGQAALEGKSRVKEGRVEARKVETAGQDWSQQAVQRQMALAEQRERQQIGERRTEHRGPGGDEQGIGERIKPTEGKEKDHQKREGGKGTIEERGSCLRLSSRANGELEEGRAGENGGTE